MPLASLRVPRCCCSSSSRPRLLGLAYLSAGQGALAVPGAQLPPPHCPGLRASLPALSGARLWGQLPVPPGARRGQSPGPSSALSLGTTAGTRCPRGRDGDLGLGESFVPWADACCAAALPRKSGNRWPRGCSIAVGAGPRHAASRHPWAAAGRQGAQPRCAGDALSPHLSPHGWPWGLSRCPGQELSLLLGCRLAGAVPLPSPPLSLRLTRSSPVPRTRGTAAMSMPGSRRSSTGSRR